MRKLMWFTIGFTLACAVCAYAFSVWLLLGIPVGLVGSFVLIRLKLRPGVAVLLGITVGLCWFGAYRFVYLAPATNADGSDLDLTAVVIDYSTGSDYGSTVKAKVSIDNKTYRAILYLKESHELKPGDQVSGSFRLRLTHEGLEGDTYHRGSGIFLLSYAQDKSEYQIADKIPLRYFPATMRKGINDRIEVLFSEDTGFFAKALLLGDRSDMDYETRTAFKVSGISHITAVSGLHVSILFSVIFLITARKRTFTALVGVPVLILFAALTGFTPSVVRACVMQILFMVADALLKEYDPPTALSAAVLVMLLVNPISVTSASLQMSAGCMVGIFLFSEKIHTWICGFSLWKDWKGKSIKVKLRNWLASGVSVTFSSMFLTTPLVAYYFGSVSLLGVVTNLLTLWAVSWIFYGIVLVCLVSLFWHQGALALSWIVSWLIRYVLVIAKAISSIPLAAVYTKSMYVVLWLILCYLCISAFLICKKKRPCLLICTMVSSLGVMLLLSWTLPMISDTRVTVLDVGQGQSVILQSQGKTFLVDCGGDNAKDAADEAAETLLSMGIYRLDGVILTHYDGDHADGIPYLLKRISVDNVFLPEYAEEEEIKNEIIASAGASKIMVHQDISLSWAESSMTVFAPISASDDNESGLCILFRGKNCDILITGDLGVSGESKLILEKDIPQLTAMVAGHHGSPYSTGEGLLARVNPEFVFISVGEDNPYGHPSQQVLERLTQNGCVVYRTDQDGTIVFRR